jgi:excisionase family DNA binding protein
MTSPLLTPAELAQLLGLSLQTIYNRRNNGGSLPPAIMLGRQVRFRQEDVDTWLQEQYEHISGEQNPSMLPPNVPAKRGRPTKEEQVRKRRESI